MKIAQVTRSLTPIPRFWSIWRFFASGVLVWFMLPSFPEGLSLSGQALACRIFRARRPVFPFETP